MTKQEFEQEMQRVLKFYGQKNFEFVHIEMLWSGFARFTQERFRDVIKIVFETCTFPPKLAEFVKASEELKQRTRNAPMYNCLPEPPLGNVFFPTEEWILAENEKMKLEYSYPFDYEHLKTFMLGVVVQMKKLHEEYKTPHRSRFEKRTIDTTRLESLKEIHHAAYTDEVREQENNTRGT